MKKLFTAIRRGDLEEVAQILDRRPELIACLAKAPPKKDDGQSPPDGGHQERQLGGGPPALRP